MNLKIMTALVAAVLSSVALATDKLVILSPHRKSIQSAFVPVFRDHYKKTYGKDVTVEWLDQGGTSAAVKFLGTRIASNPNAPGVDVFWGGTSADFVDMARFGWLDAYALSADARARVPASVAGVPLSDPQNLWHATCVSTFGILTNRKVLQLEKLPEPKTWTDLGAPAMRDNLLLTDPRQSGTNSTMNMIVLEALGWEQGSALLTAISANAKRFTMSSSDPVHGVIAGDGAAAMVIDFYGRAPVLEHGEDRLAFNLPQGLTVLDPDPVALVKGAQSRVVAQRFVEFLMTDAAQKLWLEPQLARLPVAPGVYGDEPFNPFTVKQSFLELDPATSALIRDPLNDFVGATMVDLHADLEKAWQANPAALSVPLISEAELRAAAAKWSDQAFRNATINAWVSAAKARYASALKASGAH